MRAEGAIKSFFPARTGRTLSARFAGTFPVEGKEGVYGVHNSIELPVDLVVPDSVNPEAFCSQLGIPVSIAAHLIQPSVLATINFDHQPWSETRKIHHIGTKRHLSSELEATGF